MIGIYKITNQINGKIYIGQSIDIEKRWEDHKYYNSNEKTKLQYALQKYGVSNFSFEIIELCKQEELNEKEIFWISYYNSYEDGYNMTLGGSSFSFITDIDEQKIIDNYLITKSIRKTSELLQINRDTIRKYLEKNNIPYEKNCSAPKQIYMVNPYNLEIIKTFPSIKDAAAYVKVSDSAIRKALKKDKQPYSGGYFWILDKNNTQLIPLSSTKKIDNKALKKKILQYDENGNLIAEFSSFSQANKSLGKDRSNMRISKACKGEIPMAYGFIWKMIER